MTGRDKVVVVALVGLLVLASLAAIIAEQNPSAGGPAYGGTYVEGVAGVPQYLNPVIAATDVDEDVVRLAFSGLTRYDQNGAIVPDLAAGFRTESNGRVWTFDGNPNIVTNVSLTSNQTTGAFTMTATQKGGIKFTSDLGSGSCAIALSLKQPIRDWTASRSGNR